MTLNSEETFISLSIEKQLRLIYGRPDDKFADQLRLNLYETIIDALDYLIIKVPQKKDEILDFKESISIIKGKQLEELTDNGEWLYLEFTKLVSEVII